MPIYEFRCEDCGTESDFLVRSMGGEPDEPCPSCGGSNLAKLVSQVAIHTGGKSPAGSSASASCSRSSCAGCRTKCS